VRADRSGSATGTGGSVSVRCPGTAPSTPGEWLTVCTAVAGAAGARRPPLSSLVQSSTSGPVPDAGSAPLSANS
jgi:hypothetical protein